MTVEEAERVMDPPACALTPAALLPLAVIIEGLEISMVAPPVANTPLAEAAEVVMVKGLEIVMDPMSAPALFA
jgi:hypothetical protein